MTRQLSLWDAIPAPEPQPGDPVKWSEQSYCSHGYPVYHQSERWADGDRSRSALERLALAVLGDLEKVRRFDGVECFMRVFATAVLDDQVIAAYEYVCTVKEFFGGVEDGRRQSDDDDDTDEELQMPQGG